MTIDKIGYLVTSTSAFTETCLWWCKYKPTDGRTYGGTATQDRWRTVRQNPFNGTGSMRSP